MLPLVVSLYGQSPVSVCPITDMNIPRLIRQFLRHAVQVGMEVVDVLFLITVSVYPRQRFIAAFVSIQIQALPFVCAAFLNHLQPVPQEAGTVVGLAFAVYLMFFDTPAKGVVDVAVTLTAAVCSMRTSLRRWSAS